MTQINPPSCAPDPLDPPYSPRPSPESLGVPCPLTAGQVVTIEAVLVPSGGGWIDRDICMTKPDASDLLDLLVEVRRVGVDVRRRAPLRRPQLPLRNPSHHRWCPHLLQSRVRLGSRRGRLRLDEVEEKGGWGGGREGVSIGEGDLEGLGEGFSFSREGIGDSGVGGNAVICRRGFSCCLEILNKFRFRSRRKCRRGFSFLSLRFHRDLLGERRDGGGWGGGGGEG